MVCVGNQSWPEAGIAALVIPAQSSRWTSRGQGDVHCRLADLLEENTRVSDRPLTSGHRLGASFSFNTNVEGFASSRVLRTRQLFPSPRNCPNDYSGVFARHRLSLVKPLTLIVARSQISPRDGYGSWEFLINKYLLTSLDRQYLNGARLGNRWVRYTKFTA